MKNTLTKKEQMVLEYLCQGYNNKEIGQILFISEHTVKAHLSSVFRKLNVQNRTIAAYHAGKNNLV